MIKIGVLGAGHLGRIHIQQLLQIEGIQVVGFYDPFDESAAKAEEMGVKRYINKEDLIDACDAMDIPSTTTSHYENAVACLKKKKHVFIEKPLTNTLEEAKHLLTLIQEAGVKGQVGHVERLVREHNVARRTHHITAGVQTADRNVLRAACDEVWR